MDPRILNLAAIIRDADFSGSDPTFRLNPGDQTMEEGGTFTKLNRPLFDSAPEDPTRFALDTVARRIAAGEGYDDKNRSQAEALAGILQARDRDEYMQMLPELSMLKAGAAKDPKIADATLESMARRDSSVKSIDDLENELKSPDIKDSTMIGRLVKGLSGNTAVGHYNDQLPAAIDEITQALTKRFSKDAAIRMTQPLTLGIRSPETVIANLEGLKDKLRDEGKIQSGMLDAAGKLPAGMRDGAVVGAAAETKTLPNGATYQKVQGGWKRIG